MAYWTGYFGIENINLNDTQRGLLVNALKLFGENDSPFPNFRNHRRVRLDGDAAIFEARFNEDNLTVVKFKQYLGTIFGVGSATINHVLTTPGVNTVVMFSRNGTNYLRLALFGGIGCTWEESQQAVLAYLRNNQELW